MNFKLTVFVLLSFGGSYFGSVLALRTHPPTVSIKFNGTNSPPAIELRLDQ